MNEQQKAILDVGAAMEPWGTTEAKKDDDEVAKIYAAKGVTVADLSEQNLAAWRKISEDSAWKDFAAKSTEAADLLKLAREVA